MLTAPIHERDVAAVAVAALSGSGSIAVSGPLSGPDQQRDRIAAIGAALNKTILSAS